jgi:hypothetical protein
MRRSTHYRQPQLNERLEAASSKLRFQDPPTRIAEARLADPTESVVMPIPA